MAKNPAPRLLDIINAIELARGAVHGLSQDEFEKDQYKRAAVERFVEIISEASRHLGDDIKARHPDIPWADIAGIGNVLRHEYERVAPPVIWKVVQDRLAPLDEVCKSELALAQAKEIKPDHNPAPDDKPRKGRGR